MIDTVFFTCANRKYERFAGLYICAVLLHVADSKIEIGLEDVDDFVQRNAPLVQKMQEHFGSRFHLRNADFSRSIPHTIRFITEPELQSEYLYIGDIDIIVLEPKMIDAHLGFMRRTGLPYSNSVRPNTDRLSGLHFTRRDAYWPLPDFSDLNLRRTSDEQLLYQLVKRRGLAVQDKEWWRPVHGIHISPNRAMLPADGTPGWGVHDKYAAPFRAFMNAPAMVDIFPSLADETKAELASISAHYGL